MNAFTLWTHCNCGGGCFLPLGQSYASAKKYQPGVILDSFNAVVAYWGAGLIVMNQVSKRRSIHMGRRD